MQTLDQILNRDYAQNIRSKNTAWLKKTNYKYTEGAERECLDILQHEHSPARNRIGISLGSSTNEASSKK